MLIFCSTCPSWRICKEVCSKKSTVSYVEDDWNGNKDKEMLDMDSDNTDISPYHARMKKYKALGMDNEHYANEALRQRVYRLKMTPDKGQIATKKHD